MGAVFGKIEVETPAHVVLRQANGYAIWRYPPAVAATVHHTSLPDTPPDRFERDAFITLAKYIGVFSTPQNKAPSSDTPESVAMTAPVVMNAEQGEKIAMTAPVVMSTDQGEKIAMTAPVVMTQEKEEEGEKGGVSLEGKQVGRSMTFLLPAKYGSVESAPVPTNPAVKLSMVEGGRCDAVIEFTWNLNMKRGEEKAKELMEMLERDGVKVVGEWQLYGYNSPFVLPWCRRNEVHIPVEVGDE